MLKLKDFHILCKDNRNVTQYISVNYKTYKMFLSLGQQKLHCEHKKCLDFTNPGINFDYIITINISQFFFSFRYLTPCNQHLITIIMMHNLLLFQTPNESVLVQKLVVVGSMLILHYSLVNVSCFYGINWCITSLTLSAAGIGILKTFVNGSALYFTKCSKASTTLAR